jgi:FkbM family methyltransferase
MHKVRLIFKSFPFFTAFKLVLFLTARRLLNPSASVSYAQTGEDVIIRTLLGPTPGFYVDVGCHDPFTYSNTLLLYLDGWRGLNIDANPRMIERFAARARDLAVCAAVSDEEREMVFYEFDAEAVNTLSSHVLDEWKTNWHLKSERTVRTRTLDALIAENCPGASIDLLSVDVEGHCLNVLRSIDLDVHRPRLIVVEIHGLDVRRALEDEVVRYLADKRYRLLAYATMNGYFVPE